MTKTTTNALPFPATSRRDALGEILRDGAQRMLTSAIEVEVAEWIDARAGIVNEHGHCQIVRNGHLPQRTLVTQAGEMQVKQPRVRDRRPPGEAEKFTSAILPPPPGACARARRSRS